MIKIIPPLPLCLAFLMPPDLECKVFSLDIISTHAFGVVVGTDI